ncbi:MAG: TRAP transporter small permease subunit [Bacteroidetes bacterium]|nr:TRAP transporter small permease subunit [Bacteroidota bacterium]
MNRLLLLSDRLDRFTNRAGLLTIWLSLFLVIVIIADVIIRYLTSQTAAWIPELEWHLFALLFLLGAGYTHQADRHVRVDIFYSGLSPRKKALVNTLGTFLLLLPFCVLVVVTSIPFIHASWSLGETSPDPGGLPARWLIKSAIPAGFMLLFIAGLSSGLRSLYTLLTGKAAHDH